MNKQQLQQEIESLQKQLEEKQKALAAMPDKWEPKGGGYIIGSNGSIVGGMDNYMDCREFGAEYATFEQAEKAAKAMRAHNRLLAYVAEFAPNWCANWNQESPKFILAFDYTEKLWVIRASIMERTAGAVFMPEHVAIELCHKLNSGEVEL